MANFSLKLKADFDEAIADFKKLESVSADAAAKIQRFTEGFKTEQIDRFIAKNKLNATAIKATQGPLAALQAETKGLEREIQRLIKSGLSPEDEAVRRLQKDYAKLSTQLNSTTKSTSGFANILKGVLAANWIDRGIGLLISGFKKVMTSITNIEDATATFTPLMGGAERAAQLVEALNVAAADTPYQFQAIAGVAQQLLPVMNQDIERTIGTFQMLGDTAGGSAQKLETITRGFTKAMLKGKVDMESLNMIAEAGVPIFQQMAESMGYNSNQMQEFFKKISSGTVSTEELIKAFKKMTGEGGIFFEGMITASRTMSGLWSTLKDNATILFSKIGQEMLPGFKNLGRAFISASKDGGVLLSAGKSIGLVLGKVAEFIAIIVRMTNEIQMGNQIEDQAERATKAAHSTASEIRELENTMASVRAEGLSTSRSYGQMTTDLEALSRGTGRQADMAHGYLSQMKGWKRVIDNSAAAQENISNQTNTLTRSMEENRREAYNLMGSILGIGNETNALAAQREAEHAAEAAAAAAETAAVRDGARARVAAHQYMMDQIVMSGYAQHQQRIEALQEFLQKRAEIEQTDGQTRLEWLQAQLDQADQMTFKSAADRIAFEQAASQAIQAERTKNFHRAAQAGSQMLAGTASLFQSLLQIMQNAGKSSYAMAVTLKTISAAEALVNSYLAFTQVLADKTIWPTWARIPIAGVILAAGIAKATAIATTPIPSGQTGLDYTVPDTPAMRNDRAPVMASAGENVQITPRGEEPSGSGDTVVNIDVGENNLFRIIQRGINTGKIDISRRNVGRGVFAT